MKERRRALLAALIVVVSLAVSYYLFVREKERQQAIQESQTASIDMEKAVLEEQSRGEAEVTLFHFASSSTNAGARSLVEETRNLYRIEDPVLMARQIVLALLEPEAQSESERVPGSSPLRQLYFLEDGTAVVDLAESAVDRLPGGITSELAVIHSITRTLRYNLPQIKRVRFLVGGESRRTLDGHISISDPFM